MPHQNRCYFLAPEICWLCASLETPSGLFFIESLPSKSKCVHSNGVNSISLISTKVCKWTERIAVGTYANILTAYLYYQKYVQYNLILCQKLDDHFASMMRKHKLHCRSVNMDTTSTNLQPHELSVGELAMCSETLSGADSTSSKQPWRQC